MASQKTVLLTGATEGIGKAAARALAAVGDKLVLVGRSREKTDRVAAELRQIRGAVVETCVADLSSLAEVRALAEDFKRSHDRLDVLVNNAGALFDKYELSADGFERTFALNHLGYFYLTHLLLDLLQATPGSRVVSTSSGAHNMGRIDLDDVAKREKSRKAGFRAYGDSKLANILFTKALARRFGGDHRAVCYHPGFVRTHFGAGNAFFALSARLFARTPEQGADTLIWLASTPLAGVENGGYYHDRRLAKVSAQGRDEALAESFWTLSSRLCGL